MYDAESTRGLSPVEGLDEAVRLGGDGVTRGRSAVVITHVMVATAEAILPVISRQLIWNYNQHDLQESYFTQNALLHCIEGYHLSPSSIITFWIEMQLSLSQL